MKTFSICLTSFIAHTTYLITDIAIFYKELPVLHKIFLPSIAPQSGFSITKSDALTFLTWEAVEVFFQILVGPHTIGAITIHNIKKNLNTAKRSPLLFSCYLSSMQPTIVHHLPDTSSIHIHAYMYLKVIGYPPPLIFVKYSKSETTMSSSVNDGCQEKSDLKSVLSIPIER